MFALAEGQNFERYRVMRQLGSGISGTTYEAEDMLLHRTVALKLIHPWSPLPDAARRQFFRDMQSFSFLTHPYQVTTLDYGEVAGQLYSVSRFVAAGSLLNTDGRQWFAPPLPMKDAVAYTYQLAQVLFHLHRHGRVHGSLTLSNILVVSRPSMDADAQFAPFLLADAGMAHFVRRFGRPQIARLLITEAPEQARGRVTAASDQYALAALLYLWLAGQPPFLGSPEEIERAKRASAIPRLATHNPQITFEQEGIIQRALSGYPDDRYPNILTFAETLRASLTHADRTSTSLGNASIVSPVTAKPLNQFLPTAMPEPSFPTATLSQSAQSGTSISQDALQQGAELRSPSRVDPQHEQLLLEP